jgi:hypothetical protein
MKTWVRAVLIARRCADRELARVRGSGRQGELGARPYVGWTFLDKYETLKPRNDFLAGGRVGYFFTSDAEPRGVVPGPVHGDQQRHGQRGFDLNSGR